MSGTDTRERALVDAVSLENLTRDNAEIAKGVRLSGSADEAEAFAYIADRCRSFGMDVREYTVDAYVSLPGAAALTRRLAGGARHHLHHALLLRRDGAGGADRPARLCR